MAVKDNGSEGRQNFNSGVWEKATHKEVYGSDICLEAEGRLKTEVRRLTNIILRRMFCQRLGYGFEDHTERKKTLLSKDLGKVGLNQFFLRNLNPLFLKCLIL
ncbi:hypothetical protein HID58_062391 [Brassica napus]|uniref:Uncharacterized protein n=1 Tax=Brassica napus TaxID=3708 RepID=A0ABQ8A1B7_BRANA|nr:hypothetical protein HID58_062391 [Brassica napus]